jgi:hypothetical protein
MVTCFVPESVNKKKKNFFNLNDFRCIEIIHA